MKKIYAFIAFLMFLGIAGSAFAARPTINMLAPSASDITSTSIRVTAAYKENGSNTEMLFQYTTDPGFGSGVISIPATFELVPTRTSGYFTKTITGLTPGMNYYIRAMATNDDGPYTDSGIVVKTNTPTAPTTPKVETLGETNVTSSSLSMNGRVNTYGTSGTYYFKYFSGSSCSSYLGTIGSGNLTASTGSQYQSSTLSGLNSNSYYCSELIATVNGVDYSGGKVVMKTAGSVTPPTTCNITSFYANPSSVTYGGTSTIYWTTTGCTNANLNTLGGSVSVNGSQSVGPFYLNATYKLNASNSTNTDSATLTINVGNTAPTTVCRINSNGFYADSTSVAYGGSTTLRWSTSNCSYATITNLGSVNANGSQSTGSLYATTNYTLYATGSNGTSDSATAIVNVVNNGGGCTTNCGGGTTNPACYYNSTCYFNGSTWVYYNNGGGCTTNCGGGTIYPSCYYNSTCYLNGSTWTYYSNAGTIYTVPGTPEEPYIYNPHTSYTGGPKVITKKLPPKVNTVYIDKQVQGEPINNVVTQPVDTYTDYSYGYNNTYDFDIMSRWGNANYDNTTNRVLLTGAAGYGAGFNLISILIALILIALIIYFVRSKQQREIH